VRCNFIFIFICVAYNVGFGLVVVPNPSTATATREIPGVFHASDNPMARDWVREDQAGVVFTFNFVPDSQGIPITVRIFDSFNSTVVSASGVLGNSSYAQNSVVQANIYWNGTTSDGQLAHQGDYTVEIQCQFLGQTSPTIGQSSFYLTKPDFGHSTCGGNYSIAFLPAIWLKSRKPLLRFSKSIRKRLRRPC
jgi:hypothetical protein